MYLTVKQQLKRLKKHEYESLKELSHIAKNLANEAIYLVRSHYFTEGEFLRYESVYNLLKTSPNYKQLNSNMAQQILKEVDGSFKSFFGLLKLVKKGKYSYKSVRLPSYLPKDGFTTLVVSMVRLNKDNSFTMPFSQGYKKDHKQITIQMPPVLAGKKVKEIRILPRGNAKFFEIQYTYETDVKPLALDQSNALALDLGVNNLVTAATNQGRSFIIDGRRLKSLNQWFNKENARLQCIKDKQHMDIYVTTNRQKMLLRKRKNQINDYMSKTARYIINYCIDNSIGILVVGYNETFQQNSRMGRVTNQNFVNIPYGKLKDKLEYLCKMYGIVFVKQEESYTSKASFFDNDAIPVCNLDNPKKYTFSGRRVYRGLYESSNGYAYNADVNGALNILRKSNVVSLDALYGRGVVDTPVRIRV